MNPGKTLGPSLSAFFGKNRVKDCIDLYVFLDFLEIALGDGPINSRIRDNSIWEKLYLNSLELCWVPFALIDVSHSEEDMNPNSNGNRQCFFVQEF